jgi:hypothetical protein
MQFIQGLMTSFGAPAGLPVGVTISTGTIGSMGSMPAMMRPMHGHPGVAQQYEILLLLLHHTHIGPK